MSSRSRNLSSLQAAQLTLDADPYLSCDDCFEQVDTFADSLLSGAGSFTPEFRTHLVGCAACREQAESLAELAAQDAGVDRITVRARFQRALASNEGLGV
jgi:hypothetical protein